MLIVNLAAYRFVSLDRLPERREEMRSRCLALSLKGTVLLSPEGINLFLSGGRGEIDEFIAWLRRDPLLREIKVKESLSEAVPFRELFVKVKREIIAFGVEGIDPRESLGKRISPQELKRRLDDGEPLTLLDARNTYEIDFGTFAEAIHLNLRHFRDFPEATKRLPEEARHRPMVVFCTGGIRCEKAGLFLEKEGFPEVLQLDGGVLNYFAACGGSHWNGDCFVFDERVALTPDLSETTDKKGFSSPEVADDD